MTGRVACGLRGSRRTRPVLPAISELHMRYAMNSVSRFAMRSIPGSVRLGALTVAGRVLLRRPDTASA